MITGALAIATCAQAERISGTAANAKYGKLVGHITRGPTSPISGPGIPTLTPPSVSGAELRILNSQGTLVATVHTGTRGNFQVALPAGQYRVENGSGLGGPTKNLPAKVTISEGRQTRLDILVDTGIR